MPSSASLAPLAALAILAAIDPALALAQRVSFGFVGGTNLTRDFPISRSTYQDPAYPAGLTNFDLFADTRSLIAGFSTEVDLEKCLSLEGNALHRKLQLGRRFIFPDGSLLDGGRLPVSTWEFPILLKYRMPGVRSAQPFVVAGPSFRTRHNPAPAEPSQFGGTVGAGAEFRAGRFRFSSALRYTRWQYDGDYPRIATKRDQIELVTAISYATSVPSWRIGNGRLRFGLVGGTPLTDGLEQPRGPQRIQELQGYLGGLAFELELSKNLGFEVNGLYRPFRADLLFPGLPGRFGFTVLTWQFPVLAKYRLRTQARIRPVVEAGPSFRLAGNLNGSNPSRFGFAAGGGFETDYKTVRISPVLRYTRWVQDSGLILGGFPTVRNQVELLVSFTF